MTVSLITLTNVHLAFGHHALLDGSDFSILQGDRIGLIGRNGAGKSSLLKVLDGRLEPDDGEVKRMSGLTVATVEQEPVLDEDATVMELLCGNYIEREDWQRPSIAGSLIDELGLQADARIAGLSGGTRKRVALARALADAPDLLLLDEPTNHLDIGAQLAVLRILRDRADAGATVIAALHDLSLAAAHSDRVIVLDRGRVIAAGPTETTLTTALIEQVYGVRAHLLRHPESGSIVIALS